MSQLFSGIHVCLVVINLDLKPVAVQPTQLISINSMIFFFLGKFICSCIYNCLKTSNLSFGHHTFVLSFHRISCFVFNVKIMVLRFFLCVNFSVSRICSIKIFQNRAGNFKTLLSSLYHTLIFFSCRLLLREPY